MSPLPLIAVPRRQRGTTLLEALVAMLVLSLGMFSVARVQTQMRLNADMARQRSEAVRLAQEDLERVRAFSVVAAKAGARAYADIVDATTTVDASTGYAGHTRYVVSRSVTAAGAPQAKNASVAVTWADRTGSEHQVVLNSVISGNDPAYSGALSVGPARQTMSSVNGRSARIPLAAKDLGNGSSAFKPVRGGTTALILNNTTGLVTGRCAGVVPAMPDITTADPGGLRRAAGSLLSGVVRFSTVVPPVAGQAQEAPPALAVGLTLTGGSYPATPTCASEAMKTVSYAGAMGQRVESVPIAATAADMGRALVDGNRRSIRRLSLRGLPARRQRAVVGPHRPRAGRVDHRLRSGRSARLPFHVRPGRQRRHRHQRRASEQLFGRGREPGAPELPRHQGQRNLPRSTAVKLDGAGDPIYANLSTVQHQP